MQEFDVRLFDGQRVALRRVTAGDAQAVAGVLGVPAASLLSVQIADRADRADPVDSADPADPAIHPAAPGGRWAAFAGSRRFPLRLFSRELSVLLGAGIPLLEALDTLREKEASPAVSAALAEVCERLRQGLSLSAALAARRSEFDPLFVAVVAAAERTGQLQRALRAHSDYLAWVEDLRAKLVAAAVYPAMLVIAGLSVLLFLLVFVIPRFAGLLDSVGSNVPTGSRALITLGQFTGAHPLLTIGLGVALLMLPVLALRHPALRAAGIDALWSAPALGARLRLLALARLYRTASMLLDAGVPLLAALRTSAGVASARLRPGLAAAADAVGRGERLSAAFERAGLVTPVSLQMIRVGERSGELGPMLAQAAAFYDEELARLSDLVTRLVNPLLMLLMGGLIGSVIVLMYLPIFQLVEQVQ